MALGFNFRVPKQWNRLWLLMWFVFSVTLLVLPFYVSFWPWFFAALLLFLFPEIISISRNDDGFPPLTHTIRHFLPNWVAFPLIYFFLGTVGSHWLNFNRPWRVGLLFGLLGWLTDHFSATYAKPDPFPHSVTSTKVDPRGLTL